MKKALNQSSKYRGFIRARNIALEQILQNSLSRLDQVLYRLEQMSISIAAFHSDSTQTPTQRKKMVDAHTSFSFDSAQKQILSILTNLRTASYTLAYAGEAEAIARNTNKHASGSGLDREKLQKLLSKETPSGGELNERIHLALERLRRKVVDASHLGYIQGESAKEISDRISRVFKKKTKPARVKKLFGPKLKEAKQKWSMDDVFSVPGVGKRNVSVSTGFIDDSAWDTMVSEYLGDTQPNRFLRSPEAVIGVEEGGKEVPRYLWELEKEATEDFVQNVRNGQVDAANDKGITDFIWIAIIDNKTDECCTWRDGLTSEEIQTKLDGKKHNDECDAVVPPAHNSCRCDLAPVTKELADNSPPELGDFETWLKK